jgi:amino acid transporter
VSPRSTGSWARGCSCCSWWATSSGPGVYALTGKVAAEVGGAVWLPFLVAFVVAILTAFSYLELVTKYPQAAGAALYTHKAFGIHFLTFMVTFTVMCSG